MAKKTIKTADEHIADHKRHMNRKYAETYRDKKALARARFIGDLRDDTLSIVKNSGLSDAEIYSKFGASPSTLKAWRGETSKPRTPSPQSGTIRATLRACGKDIGIVDYVPKNTR